MASTSAPVLNTVPPNQRIVVTNEKVTGPAAAELLRRSKIIQSCNGSLEVLDNATGGGILLAELFKLASTSGVSSNFSRVVAGDIDDSMLNATRLKQDDTTGLHHRAWQRVEVTKIDQQAIPMPDESFTHVFSNMGIFFCQDDDKALREAHRVLKPGGIVGFTSWKSIAWWEQIAQPAIKKYIPEAPELPTPGQLFPSRGWSAADAIPAKLTVAGFADVRVSEYGFTPDVEAGEFAEATGVLVKIVVGRLWSAEQHGSYADRIQPALQRYLEENYEGGKWSGTMTALITIGTKA
ncbi:hypothetical protein LTR53_004201 [Teratosphaeriaceae sp. CCFEE 6253]|nr:hypothetical protein LTR53_004201 [Teratosphaeriaceae sp. CCFEE 6253]